MFKLLFQICGTAGVSGVIKYLLSANSEYMCAASKAQNSQFSYRLPDPSCYGPLGLALDPALRDVIVAGVVLAGLFGPSLLYYLNRKGA